MRESVINIRYFKGTGWAFVLSITVSYVIFWETNFFKESKLWVLHVGVKGICIFCAKFVENIRIIMLKDRYWRIFLSVSLQRVFVLGRRMLHLFLLQQVFDWCQSEIGRERSSVCVSVTKLNQMRRQTHQALISNKWKTKRRKWILINKYRVNRNTLFNKTTAISSRNHNKSSPYLPFLPQIKYQMRCKIKRIRRKVDVQILMKKDEHISDFSKIPIVYTKWVLYYFLYILTYILRIIYL